MVSEEIEVRIENIKLMRKHLDKLSGLDSEKEKPILNNAQIKKLLAIQKKLIMERMMYVNKAFYAERAFDISGEKALYLLNKLEGNLWLALRFNDFKYLEKYRGEFRHSWRSSFADYRDQLRKTWRIFGGDIWK